MIDACNPSQKCAKFNFGINVLSDASSSLGLILGSALGSVVFVGSTSAGILLVYKRQKRSKAKQKDIIRQDDGMLADLNSMQGDGFSEALRSLQRMRSNQGQLPIMLPVAYPTMGADYRINTQSFSLSPHNVETTLMGRSLCENQSMSTTIADPTLRFNRVSTHTMPGQTTIPSIPGENASSSYRNNNRASTPLILPNMDMTRGFTVRA